MTFTVLFSSPVTGFFEFDAWSYATVVGYLISDDSILKNTKRNWTRGEETAEKTFISANVKSALENVQSWHDPEVTYGSFTGFGVSDVANKLSDLDATGMPVPITFMRDAADLTGISYTGTPKTDYLEGERFDTGDHSKQSPGPDTDEPDSDSEFSIWANYSDGSFAEITDYDVIYQQGGNAFEAGDTTVRIQASLDNETLTKDFTVTVAANKLLSMDITSLPTNVLYARNEHFDPDGMTVTTRYGSDERAVMAVKTTWKDGYLVVTRAMSQNGSFPGNTYEEITGDAAEAFTYTLSPDAGLDLTPDKTKVTVSHTFAGDTMSKEVDIRVLESEAPMITKDSYNNWSIDIETEDDLIWFANKINTREKQDMGATLLANITVSEPDFDPIGYYRGKAVSYTGEFNGTGKTITLDMERHGKPAALFCNIGTGGLVKDLTIEGSVSGGIGKADDDTEVTTAFNTVSSVATAVNGGTIENCINNADITADNKVHAGGIAGELKGGSISGCTNEGNVTGGGLYTGGITALNTTGGTAGGSITNCSNNGSVMNTTLIEGITGKDMTAGGIAGTFKTGTIENCVNTGEVTAGAAGQAGGVTGTLYAGALSPVLNGCINTAKVELKEGADLSAAGGIAGSIFATGKNTKIQDCLNAGVVLQDNDSTVKGAIIGSASKLTAAQLDNATGNMALEGTSAMLIGTVSSAVEGNITESNFRFSEDLSAIFEEKGLADEYAKALEDLEKYGGEPVAKINIKTRTISLSGTKFTYTGKAIKPSVTVKGLTKGTDYMVAYNNNKAIGKAKVTITGTGKYEGSVVKSFTIVPKKVTGLKLTAGKKKLTIKFTKSTGGVKYQVAYRKKGVSKWTMKKITGNSLTVRKLKSGKYYQAKVRAYKVVSGTTYWGAWTTIKQAKVK